MSGAPSKIEPKSTLNFLCLKELSNATDVLHLEYDLVCIQIFYL